MTQPHTAGRARRRYRGNAEEALRALHAIAVAVGGVLDPAKLARIVAGHATDLLRSDAVALYLWDPDAELLRPLFANDPRATSPDRPLAPGQGIAGLAFARREAVVVNDYASWEMALPVAAARGLRAALAVPLIVDDRQVGALVVRSYARRTYGDAQQNLLTLLAAQVAPAFEAARLYTTANRLAKESAARAAELAASERRLRALVGSALDVIAVLDVNGVVSFVGPSVEDVLGYAPAAVEQQNAFALVHPDDRGEAEAALARALGEPRTRQIAELRLQHADGSWRNFELIIRNELADPAVAGVVATYHDITERKSFESDLRYLAFHDPLLAMPNRVLFTERLERALNDADASARKCERCVGVLFIDLDNFKIINDSLGHAAGDELLMTVAERLRSCVRDGDSTGRLGGDEFTILLERINGVDDATAVANRVVELLKQPVVLNGHVVLPSASVGVAVSDADRRCADDLLRAADLAMYRAKARGKGRVELFEASMDQDAMQRLELESDLRRVIERNELRVHYQPLVSLDTGRIYGAEALVRWEHASRGLIPPDQFIPLAEETGMILAIGEWVLEQACQQAQLWQALLPEGSSFTMNVNLSGKQVLERDLVEDVARVLRATGLNPGSLTLEITETEAMADTERTTSNMRGLKDLGVRVVMDDFGTGFASLSYLKRFPLDGVKIDRSFVDRLGQDADDTAIVRAILALADALNLDVTAEGVETREQMRDLRRLGCKRGQGYHFARPQTSEAFTGLLVDGAPLGSFRPARALAA